MASYHVVALHSSSKNRHISTYNKRVETMGLLNIPIHPGGGAATGQYLSNNDGSVKVPAMIALPETFPKVRHDLENYKWKDGDFLLTTYPKNGTHYMWEAMTMLLRGRADYIKEPKQMVMIDLFPISKSEGVFPSPRVLNTHYTPDILGSEFRNEKTVIVIRNPKDVCVSLFHHEVKLIPQVIPEYQPIADLTFSDFLKMFLYNKDVPYGSYFDYTSYVWSLRNDPNVLIVFFEDMKMDAVGTIQKVSEFMGTETSPEIVQEIADATNFDKMKKAKTSGNISDDLATKIKSQSGRTQEESKAKFQLISEKMYRKGVIGDWKNHFTVADNELFDAFLESWEDGKDIPFKY